MLGSVVGLMIIIINYEWISIDNISYFTNLQNQMYTGNLD